MDEGRTWPGTAVRMSDIPFDTMATARLLRDSGIEERQAAAITTAIKDGVTGGVATKTDLERVESALRTDIERVESALRTDIARLDADIARLETEFKADTAKLESALRTDIARLETEFKADFARLETELRWMRLIGAAVLAVLVLPWLAELVSATMP